MIEPAFPLLLSSTCIVFVALLFARAAVHKVSDFIAFTGFVADYNLVPERMIRPVSMLLAGAEVAVVAFTTLPMLRPMAAGLAIALLLAYAGGMAANLRRGRDRIECGCGGAVQPLSWTLVWRNLVLAAMALPGLGAASGGFGIGGSFAVVIGGFTLFLAYLLAEQILANAAFLRLKRSRHPKET